MAEDIKKEVDTGADESKETEPKTYTQEELDALLQAETDRRVTSALKKAQEKSKKEIENAKKLAKMDEDERAAFELKSAQEELAQLRKEKAMSENTATTLQVLSKRGLPSDLLDFVLTEDADSTLENIKTVEKMLKAWVDAEVTKRIPTQGTPKSGTDTSKLTKEQFRLMGLAQQAKIATENPELYKQLTT